MNQIYLLQNQDKLFLSKQNEWVDGREPGSLFKTRHKDEALNQLFETNAKDYSQRIRILACDVKPNGFPLVNPEDMPEPLPKTARGEQSPAQFESSGETPVEAGADTAAEGDHQLPGDEPGHSPNIQ